jgi:hypothetical protein
MICILALNGSVKPALTRRYIPDVPGSNPGLKPTALRRRVIFLISSRQAPGSCPKIGHDRLRRRLPCVICRCPEQPMQQSTRLPVLVCVCVCVCFDCQFPRYVRSRNEGATSIALAGRKLTGWGQPL